MRSLRIALSLVGLVVLLLAAAVAYGAEPVLASLAFAGKAAGVLAVLAVVVWFDGTQFARRSAQ